jgi:hypothetical protein
MSLAFDEFGKPYLIVREQTRKQRTKGIEAVKVIACNNPQLELI